MALYRVCLSVLEDTQPALPRYHALREFHICNEIREDCGLRDSLFSLSGNVIFADMRGARELSMKLNSRPGRGQFVRDGQLNAMGLIDEILHYMVSLYRRQVQPDVFDTALERLEQKLGSAETGGLLETFSRRFPPRAVYAGKSTIKQYLASSEEGESCRAVCLEEVLLLAIANLNPAFKPFLFLFDEAELAVKSVYPDAVEELKTHLASLPAFGPNGMNLWDMLRAPALASPDSLLGQLEFMRKNWGLFIGKFMGKLLTGLDVIKEEEKPFFGGPGPSEVMDYGWLENEYEAFSPDQDWMPRTVLMAKSTLVWLYQLTQKYKRDITRLDQIPDAELDELARRGFTGLWLIGLWERSQASKTVKQWTGNPEAAASAYSLHDYDIAAELGGWEALANLRDRCFRRGIRLGSDMVPNHTGLDSRWIMEHPDRFLQLSYPPFPSYTFNGGNLSNRDGVGIYLEDHYYNRTDASVVFKRVDFNSGDTRYIYHGNDGTSMPWNDTAQIDFLNPDAREAVIRTIIGVCQQFSIVRFDAAMTLAKRHIQRLWYPEPGHGGDIASRSEHAIPAAEFNRRIPNEFWREVVDRCAAEAPHTLLLAEAFWMMEGYFVRTLGMHRVYNSAFMNMLKNEENAKYRATIKNTLEFDPEVLKRFVNFMNNPDEETAVAQFGKGDKYFGIATLLVTMPGLPMFGHGQVEGFEEKYGMEYRRSYRDEKPDAWLVDRHEREIFPLMKKRYLFSGSAAFVLYDLVGMDGNINENVFAYSNRSDWNSRGGEKALVFYNNSYYQVSGRIRRGAVAIPQKDGTHRQDDLCAALGLTSEARFFTILHEQRSGLWFIRSSKELDEQGLFVGLNGYEAQVFMDIHEKADVEGAAAGTWDARWARLNHELAGRGVRDLDRAILEIYLRDLYAPLGEIFDRERIAAFLKAAGEKSQAEIAGVIQNFREPALAFAKAAVKFIIGVEGGYAPFKSPKEAVQILHANHEKIWKEFSDFLNRLALIVYEGLLTPEYTDTETPDAAADPGAGIVPAGGSPEDRALVRLAPVLGYGLLGLLRQILGGSAGTEAVLLADHWHLFQKLVSIWEELGMNEFEAARAADIARAVLVRTFADTIPPGFAGNADADRIAAAVILENYEADDFRALFGINRFEGVIWFNRERFREVMFWAPRFLLGESGAAFGAGVAETSAEASMGLKKRAKLIGAALAGLRRAEKASGYKLNDLLEALSGEEIPVKTESPKAAKGKKRS